jgi:hypothetical protein
MTTAWWQYWLRENAPAALDGYDRLSSQATRDPAVVRGFTELSKVVERYHQTGAKTHAQRTVAEIKALSDAYDSRTKLISSIANMQGGVTSAQVAAAQRHKEALIRAQVDVQTSMSRGDPATVSKVQAVNRTRGADAAVGALTQTLRESGYLTDTDYRSPGYAATFMATAGEGLNINVEGLYDLTAEQFSDRAKAAGISAATSLQEVTDLFVGAKSAHEYGTAVVKQIDEDIKVADQVFSKGKPSDAIAADARKLQQENTDWFQSRLPANSPESAALLQQQALDVLRGYTEATEDLAMFRGLLQQGDPKVDQKRSVLMKPGFHAWAKQHGFERTGKILDDGAYSPGADDYDAYAEFLRQFQKKRPPTIGRHAGREIAIQYDEPLDSPEARKKFDAEHKVAGGYVKIKDSERYMTRAELEKAAAPQVKILMLDADGRVADQDAKGATTYLFNEGAGTAYAVIGGKITEVPLEDLGTKANAAKDALDVAFGAEGDPASVRSIRGNVDSALAKSLDERFVTDAEGVAVLTTQMAIKTTTGAESSEIPPLWADRELRLDYKEAAEQKAEADPKAIPEGKDPLTDFLDRSRDTYEVVDKAPRSVRRTAVEVPLAASFALETRRGDIVVRTADGDHIVIGDDQNVDRREVPQIGRRISQGDAMEVFGESTTPNRDILLSGRSDTRKAQIKAERAEAQRERMERRLERAPAENLAAMSTDINPDAVDPNTGEPSPRPFTPNAIKALRRATAEPPPAPPPLMPDVAERREDRALEQEDRAAVLAREDAPDAVIRRAVSRAQFLRAVADTSPQAARLDRREDRLGRRLAALPRDASSGRAARIADRLEAVQDEIRESKPASVIATKTPVNLDAPVTPTPQQAARAKIAAIIASASGNKFKEAGGTDAQRAPLSGRLNALLRGSAVERHSEATKRAALPAVPSDAGEALPPGRERVGRPAGAPAVQAGEGPRAEQAVGADRRLDPRMQRLERFAPAPESMPPVEMPLEEADAKGLNRAVRDGVQGRPPPPPPPPGEADLGDFDLLGSMVTPAEAAGGTAAVRSPNRPSGAALLMKSLRTRSDTDAMWPATANRSKKA